MLVKKMFKKLIVVFLLLICTFTSSSCNIVDHINPGDFDDYTDRLLHTLLGKDELTIHFLFKDKSTVGIDETTISLPTPGSTSALGLLIINLYFGPIKNYNYDELSFDQKMTYNVIVDLLDRINNKTQAMSYLDNNYLGSYLGYQAQLPILLERYRIDNLEDVENYFALLKLIPDTFKEYYDYEVIKTEAGYGMSDFIIDKVVDQCREFVQNKDEHFLITTFPSRIEHLNLSEQDFNELVARNKEIIQNDACAGYQYILDNLPNLKGKATNDLGLAHYTIEREDGSIYELGKEYYQYLFERATGYDDEIEDAISYIQNHLDAIIANIKEIRNAHPAINDELDDITLMGTDVDYQMELYKELIANDFPTISDYPTIHILDVDPALEDHFSPAAYITSPIDDYENEYIYLNQKKIDGDYNYLYTTLSHEGIPGHMYQNIYFKSLDDVNLVRKVLKNTGYQEGWATYVELYSYNYIDDVEDYLIDYLRNYHILNGVLTARLDMGIHYEGWDSADILDYMSHYFSGYTLERCQSILEQLVEVPTNSQSYYYTYFKICDMQKRVEEALGENYDPIAFHQLILECGPVPLRFIEPVVDEYIRSYE